MIVYANDYKRKTTFKTFLFYCDTMAKKEKEVMYQNEYDSNRFYDMVNLLFKQVTGKEPKEIKSWSSLKSDLRQPHKQETRTDEEITQNTLQKYNELFKWEG